MRYIGVVLLMFVFSGCVAVNPAPKAKKQDTNVTVVEKSIVSELVKSKKIQSEALDNSHILYDVFDSELYFAKDKAGKNLNKIVIEHLEAYYWEKRVLNRAYRTHKKLWSKKQSKDFRKVLEEDKYFSLCSDRRYWENLEFEESEPERDILHSILLIKYLNNLSNGCSKWVESNGKIKDENKKEHINAKQIFSLLPHDVLIEKLLLMYVPKDKSFTSLLQKHRTSLESDKKSDEIKTERLKIEKYKALEKNPDYKK